MKKHEIPVLIELLAANAQADPWIAEYFRHVVRKLKQQFDLAGDAVPADSTVRYVGEMLPAWEERFTDLWHELAPGMVGMS